MIVAALPEKMQVNFGDEAPRDAATLLHQVDPLWTTLKFLRYWIRQSAISQSGNELKARALHAFAEDNCIQLNTISAI